MGIKAFTIYDLEPVPFFERFLQSSDFTVTELKAVTRDLGIRGSKTTKDDIVTSIMQIVTSFNVQSIAKEMMPYLVMRQKEWLSLRIGHVGNDPVLLDPSILATSRGEEKWYGPILRPDDVTTSRWYVRPHFVPHYEKDASGDVKRQDIRWLCFARIEPRNVSLHWRGFTFSESVEVVGKNIQFPYWRYIRKFFDEIISLTDAEVDDINPAQLFLYDLWEYYRDKPEYHWVHRRVRARSAIISLNAHAGGEINLEDEGILNFVRVIRRAINDDLVDKHNISLPSPESIDEVILMTLLRELGTISYEFYLNCGSSTIFRAHTYFGFDPDSTSVDGLIHHNLSLRERPDLGHLEFLLQYLLDIQSNEKD
jgi:hypothetical protein